MLGILEILLCWTELLCHEDFHILFCQVFHCLRPVRVSIIGCAQHVSVWPLGNLQTWAALGQLWSPRPSDCSATPHGQITLSLS